MREEEKIIRCGWEQTETQRDIRSKNILKN